MPTPGLSVKSQRNFVVRSPGAASFKGGTEYAIHKGRKAIKSVDASIIESWLAAKVVTAAIPTESPTWVRNANNIEANISLEAISDTVSSLLSAITEKGTKAVSFHALVASRGKAEHLVAILRSTFPWRAEIGGWRQFEQAVRRDLYNRGMDVSKVMKGLER
ncbi:hypothetical protein [Janthinobacterium lividum]|uniref:hypothetical protein n=1 Tax=Janthinobacterium lividum TaxID=29581 RepID=UPI0012698B5D|nr:hypothetical protein [Janthinobacterium lividum]